MRKRTNHTGHEKAHPDSTTAATSDAVCHTAVGVCAHPTFRGRRGGKTLTRPPACFVGSAADRGCGAAVRAWLPRQARTALGSPRVGPRTSAPCVTLSLGPLTPDRASYTCERRPAGERANCRPRPPSPWRSSTGQSSSSTYDGHKQGPPHSLDRGASPASRNPITVAAIWGLVIGHTPSISGSRF